MCLLNFGLTGLGTKGQETVEPVCWGNRIGPQFSAHFRVPLLHLALRHLRPMVPPAPAAKHALDDAKWCPVPCPQFPVPSSSSLSPVPCPKFPVPSLLPPSPCQFHVPVPCPQFPSSLSPVCCPQFPAPQFPAPVPCPQFPVPSSLSQVPCLQFAAPSSLPKFPVPVPCPQFPVPCPQFAAPSSLPASSLPQFPAPSSLSPVPCPKFPVSSLLPPVPESCRFRLFSMNSKLGDFGSSTQTNSQACCAK